VATPNPSNPSLFAVVISEKGGAERREAFDRPEISVGRVQGNELMLPKGNVSKRHARLLFRDNRFIVTDLNSTNGTYVNRRRISQATIVREGDRIYIGDFVLRIELPNSDSEDAPSSSDEVSVSAPAPAGAVELPQSALASVADVEPNPVRRPLSAGAGDAAPGPPPPPELPPVRSPDPRSSAPGVLIQAPAAVEGYPSSASLPPPAATTHMPPAAGASSEPPEQSSSDRASSKSREFLLPADVLAHRAAVRAVVGRVTEMLTGARLAQPVDETARQRIEQAAIEQFAALRGEGVVAAEIDEERVIADSRAELSALGPLGLLLNDDQFSEVSVTGFAHVVAAAGDSWRVIEPPFSSEESLERVIERLCRLAGREPTAAEAVVDRVLPGGARLRAVRGSLAGGRSMIALRKPRRVATSVDDLVRRGTLSRAMATFLRHVVVAGGNILVVGARDARASDVANALASLSDAYWITVGDDTEFLVGDSRVTRLSLSREDVGTRRVLSAAAQLGGARLLVENASAELGVGVIESVGAGASGLIASLVAGSLEQGLERLVTDCMARAGSGRDAARQQVASAFSLVIEVAQLRDHRFRVLRIAEPSGATVDGFELEDIFAFSFQRTAAGGAVEGTFAATGAVPRLAPELGSRGVPIEAGLFSRSSR